MAVTSMSATFNKLSIFAFCVYTSRTSSTCAIGKFYLHFKQVLPYFLPLSLFFIFISYLYINIIHMTVFNIILYMYIIYNIYIYNIYIYIYIYIYIFIYIYVYLLLSRYNNVHLFFKIIKNTFFVVQIFRSHFGSFFCARYIISVRF